MLQLWKVTKVNIRDSTSQGLTVPKMNTHPAKGQYKKLLRLLSIFPLNLLFNQMHKISPKFLGFIPSKPKLKFRCFPLLLEPPQNFVVPLLTLKLKPESLQMLSQWIFIRQIKNRFYTSRNLCFRQNMGEKKFLPMHPAIISQVGSHFPFWITGPITGSNSCLDLRPTI